MPLLYRRNDGGRPAARTVPPWNEADSIFPGVRSVSPPSDALSALTPVGVQTGIFYPGNELTGVFCLAQTQLPIDTRRPRLCNLGVTPKEFAAGFIIDGIQRAGEIHALRTQKRSQCHEKTCYCQKVCQEQKPLKAGNQENERVSPDKRKPREKYRLFQKCHRTGAIFPDLGRPVVRPAFQGAALLGIMGAVGTHHPDFNKTEIADYQHQPRHQQPPIYMINPGSPQKKRGRNNQKKIDQIPKRKMAMQRAAKGALVTCTRYAGCNRLVWVQKFHQIISLWARPGQRRQGHRRKGIRYPPNAPIPILR